MTISEIPVSVTSDPHWRHLEIDLTFRTLPQALQVAASTWPDRPAFHFVDQDLVQTWAELEDRVMSVAGGLARIGIRPGDRIGIMLENVPEFPAAWLGILAVGAIAVPMNPRYTPREVGFVVDDTGMSGLVIAADRLPVIDELAPDATVASHRVVVVGHPGGDEGRFRAWDDVVRGPRLPAPYALAAPHDVANIQYTSGTTGLPKGCMLTHEYWAVIGRSGAALRGQDVRNILADHPFFYLQNQSYFAHAVVIGAQLHVTHGLSLHRFLGWLRDFKIDSGWVSAALLSLPPSPDDANHLLRYVPTDGIDPAKHAELEKRFGMVVREWYASTEIGLGTVSPWDDVAAVGSGSMGFPAPLRETKVVDQHLVELPRGEVGELCVRGPGMMRGYWNRAEINAELFIDGGWFRTGDLVRIDPDGQHYFMGRAKDMVRRSGENIAASEVEQQLAAHPAVKDAAVIPVPDVRRGEEIKAIVVLRDGADATPQELADWCRDRLAPYKIPRYIAFRTELPYTPSGKVHKARLKDENSDLRLGAFDLVDGVSR